MPLQKERRKSSKDMTKKKETDEQEGSKRGPQENRTVASGCRGIFEILSQGGEIQERPGTGFCVQETGAGRLAIGKPQKGGQTKDDQHLGHKGTEKTDPEKKTSRRGESKRGNKKFASNHPEN